ncbi:MAG TPA: hypothetical protein VHB25_01470 [Gemmatimonadaceae bacterium]|nr:hypothetical protein [Gemmatimonadaceae bacterium]
MPITAKLSRRFYEQFGDEIVAELVDWFNAVDATYRSDLREINELNFSRFDAKLEQRFAEQDARWERRFAQQDAKWEHRFAEQDAKWDRRFAEQDAKWERRFAELESRIETTAAGLRTELVRWMFAFWTTNTLMLAGLLLAVLRSR